MSIMTSPADLLARTLIGCIQPRVRGQDLTAQSPGSTELWREARGVHLEGQMKAIQHKKYHLVWILETFLMPHSTAPKFGRRLEESMIIQGP